MDKIILDKQQVQELVFQNRYPVSENKFLSRCIDGRYSNKNNLPALAIPGADLGELALILAAGNAFGFELSPQKTLTTLTDLLGGAKNFHFHSDHHADPKIPAGGCGHWRQLQADPAAYNLEEKDIKFIKEKLPTLVRSASKIHKQVVLHGEHREGAILMVKGNYGIYPQFILSSRLLSQKDGKATEAQVFVYHQSLVDERHRVLAKKLIKNQAVVLYPGCDEEYLYETLSETAENHLFEILKRLAKGLPIFQVEFKDGGGFEVKEMGKT